MKGWVCLPKDKPEDAITVLADTRNQARAIACIELECDYIDVLAYRDTHVERWADHDNQDLPF
jgi:hypothetical protein